ncbi:MAG: flagellar hook-basal body complex protein FliE [Melioribacteraceae bacterium]|jgi:flagellar hook-basal body complex protein FliE|nr:flagellar hook-basal body complex protein FliE [Melioribacteraceae bacterium]RJP56711.1 MAG: flagellar hook-basal body complex protein FliE [Ignavibacteriales bacterium]WKZ70179.1 MAG: flagellar hook-basal body complex protein FliE [Melioribacteraceae bacterium]
MKIEGIINQIKINPQLQVEKKQPDAKFENILGSFIDQVKESGAASNQITQDFILGGDVEIHEVMIAAEKAKTDMMLLTEIRNKALDTFNELSKMQI